MNDDPKPPKGLASLERFDLLPLLRDGVQARYEGSIDKQGFNADWDWLLYKDGAEFVIFDVDGPGCIYNFVQHRYPDSPEPTFRFYFDGEAEPRFELKHAEFGAKAPFVKPLADAYLGPEEGGRGPIRVVRSFVPMPYARSCKITTDIRLKGANKGDGGWGHVVYHAYAEADEGLATFTGNESYERVRELWSRVGEDPKPDLPSDATVRRELSIAPGDAVVVFEAKGAGCIVSMLARTPGIGANELWIRATWDGHGAPDVYSPLGAFFGNELGFNAIGVLSHGTRTDGISYNYFPMPFWRGARVELVNKSDKTIRVPEWDIRCTFEASALAQYREGRAGYFRSSSYRESRATLGSDAVIGEIAGNGHMVAAQVTAFARKPGTVSCEGDVRVYIDGIATPQIESDGSESYVCYGWGFPTPPQTNPSSGYDGLPDNPWSMVRLCAGDCYPFRERLVFGIESGDYNNQYLRHSGILFYYGVDAPGMRLTDELDVGDRGSEEAHGYASIGGRGSYTVESGYEDGTHRRLADTGRETEGSSEFTVAIDPRNAGVRVRRRSDQITGRQRAHVYVDGERVEARSWYFADRNPYKRWLEDEFDIPAKYTSGKTDITIRLVFEQEGENRVWNEFYYWIYSLV
ncbi:DUF2961 domain-containing protein [Cohnella rhizosphaerae]|uniref:DUF2961 domain-containing protein n=1 Tax=Cohnella rhizosphaerae TaxID=1457232 RepID=A0A9X4QVQ4_9BACL|nr:DUF2961 domain-containing protein [Cohnella rhizosphaerae]MDG0812980.1 DUF2961 domain-containing protein [Cohnella rhizosphaerae]